MAWQIWAFIKFLFFSTVFFFLKTESSFEDIRRNQVLESIFINTIDGNKSKVTEQFAELNRLLKNAKAGK